MADDEVFDAMQLEDAPESNRPHLNDWENNVRKQNEKVKDYQIDDLLKTINDLRGSNKDLWQYRKEAMAALKDYGEKVEILEEFFDAFQEVEAGTVSFNLQNEAVQRLTKARDAVRRGPQ